MRPEKVSSWREKLPPPFNKPSPILQRRGSTTCLEGLDDNHHGNGNLWKYRKRRSSASGALIRADRRLDWLRFIEGQNRKLRSEQSALAVEKLAWLRRRKAHNVETPSDSEESLKNSADLELMHKRSVASKTLPEKPTHLEISALAAECFPRIEQSRVVIVEYSNSFCRASEFTLEEVLASEHILQPGACLDRIRWIYVDYHKIGTFWGSDLRFSQWGTDPTLFEKSPILLLQHRLAELDQKAGRASLEDEEIPGYKRIGKYYRQVPGCPEYLGLRVNSSAWLESEPYDLLLDYLKGNPSLATALQDNKQNDLEYALAYINAVQALRDAAYRAKPGLRRVHQCARKEAVYAYGNWDDHVERHEFWGAHTLLSCGSPRLYNVITDRLLRREDPLRQNPDCAFLYYTLVRVSVENDEMMQDTPERALNKIFTGLKDIQLADKQHVEEIFNLQQAVLDGLEYLEDNQRELPIWGIPPFENHQVNFHPDHNPSETIRNLIQREMNLVEKDFTQIIRHWQSLKSKVDRHLDVILQFRVLEQQELALEQRDLATKQQNLAVEEARSSRIQSKSIVVFTALTIIFLPLSFFTSYFGMGLSDFSSVTPRSFWMISGPVSVAIFVTVFVLMRTMSAIREPDEEMAMMSSQRSKSQSRWASLWPVRGDKSKLS